MQFIDNIQYYQPFPAVIPVPGAGSLRVTHPSAMISAPLRKPSHRLACVKHSVSVHPEPGSNSSFNLFIYFTTLIFIFLGVCFFFYFHCPFAEHFSADKIYTIKYFLFCQCFFFLFSTFLFFLLILLDFFFSFFIYP